MLIRRLKELNKKTGIVFRYLACLDAVKLEKGTERFDKTFQEIERYLSENEWTLAEYWIERVQSEYEELLLIGLSLDEKSSKE